MRIDTEHLERFIGECGRFPADFERGPSDPGGLQAVRQWINELAQRHHFLGPTAAQRLGELVEKSRLLDWLLAFTGKRYRDHAVHQWRVAALGWFLLHAHVLPDIPLWQYAAQRRQALGGAAVPQNACGHRDCPPDRIAYAWWVAALMHDHAYPLCHMLQTLESVLLLVRGAAPGEADRTRTTIKALAQTPRTFAGDALAVMDSPSVSLGAHDYLRRRLVACGVLPAQGVPPANDPNLWDHGMWSAANLCNLFADWNFPLSAADPHVGHLVEALRAIAVHSELPSAERSVSIKDNPLGWLLCLCDELQEWDRCVAVAGCAVPETDHIELDGIAWDGNAVDPIRFTGDDLVVAFKYSDQRTLELTEWNAEIFLKSKSKRLGRLCVPTGLRPNCIRIQLIRPATECEVSLR